MREQKRASALIASRRTGGWAVVGLVGAFALAGAILFIVEIARVASGAMQWRRTDAGELAAARRDSRDYLISPALMDSADAALARAVRSGLVPGATLAMGRGGHIVQLAAYGHVAGDASPLVSADSTRYDLASLTKAVATTTAVLLLAQDGRIDLDAPVQRWLPDFSGRWKDSVTWRHLLTHTSGLPPGGHMTGRTSAQRLESLLRTKLDAPPGSEVQYSDLSFIVLWTAAQRAAGEPLQNYLKRRVWLPLGMRSTDFWPGLDCNQCAPTLILHTGEPYRGKPSDPIAHKLGIPSGNAGLFSTAHDLGRFAAMVANGGVYDGKRILRADLARQLFEQMPGAGHRSLGWDAFCPQEKVTQQTPCAHPIAYGHTGWTGTSLWIDPARRSWVVILSNRSYDVKKPPSLDDLREAVFLRVASGAGSPVVARDTTAFDYDQYVQDSSAAANHEQ